MAPQIPEIEVPSATPEQTPVVPTPTPPLGAFGGAVVGAGLTDFGKELYGIGHQEYHRAIEARAQEAENNFQEKALKLRDEYRGKLGWDAVQAHPEVTAALEKARAQIGQSLNSKDGRVLYNNNTLRNARLMQESIDSWFEQQNRSYQIGEYKKSLRNNANMAAGLAQDGLPNLAAAKEMFDASYDRSLKFGLTHGLNQEEAEQTAKVDASQVVDAYVVSLSKRKDLPASALQSAFDQFKGQMSAHAIEGVGGAVTAKVGNDVAREVVYGAKRFSAQRGAEPDADGQVDEGDVWRRLEAAKVPDDRMPAVMKSIREYLTLENARFDARAKQKVAQVMADGQTVDGVFHLDRQKSASEIAWLRRNAPGGPGQKPGLAEIEALERKTDKQQNAQDNEVSLRRLRVKLVNTLAQNPQAIKDMTPADINRELLGGDYPGVDEGGMRKAEAMLKAFQSTPKVQLIEKIPKHIDEFLEGIYGKGDDDLKKKYHEELVAELSESMMQSGEKAGWDDNMIEQFIHRAFQKKLVQKNRFFDDVSQLIDLRIKAREAQGGGRLPVKVQRDRQTGNVRVVYGTD